MPHVNRCRAQENAMTQPFDIVFALYPRITQLDFTGPFEVLARMPGARCILASVDGGELAADRGLRLAGLRRLAAGARYVTSVCTGSLLLAAAGLLHGKRAACHWAWRDKLADLGAVPD